VSNICEKCGGITGSFAERVAQTLNMVGQRSFVCHGHAESIPRDTQFAGFARLLKSSIDIAEMCPSTSFGEVDRRIELLIAQRAYDLVAHTLRQTMQGVELLFIDDESWIKERVVAIPDMTEWPHD